MIIIYKCTKHCNYLPTHLHEIQTYLQSSKLLKHVCTDTKVNKMPRGARKLMGENLKPVWAEFSTKLGCIAIRGSKCILS